MSLAAVIIENEKEFLRYLKSKFPLYHQSNIFFRDLHYGVMNYLVAHKKRIRYAEAEQVSREVAAEFEKTGILRKIDKQTWLLIYPEFQLPRVKKAS